MKKMFAVVLALAIALAFGLTPALAGIGSDIPDNGSHYNLNIIGVPKDKTADMTDSNRHTIFVPLGKDGQPARGVQIQVVRNMEDPTQFVVLDGNATDDGVAVVAVPWEDYGVLSFNVYATALGKPNGHVYVEATAVFDDDTYAELLMGSFELTRLKGKPQPENISDIFRASGFIDTNDSGAVYEPGVDIAFNNVWVFNIPTLLDYYWTYTNSGLKLMQVRFYPTTSGSWDIPA